MLTLVNAIDQHNGEKTQIVIIELNDKDAVSHQSLNSVGIETELR